MSSLYASLVAVTCGSSGSRSGNRSLAVAVAVAVAFAVHGTTAEKWQVFHNVHASSYNSTPQTRFLAPGLAEHAVHNDWWIEA